MSGPLRVLVYADAARVSDVPWDGSIVKVVLGKLHRCVSFESIPEKGYFGQMFDGEISLRARAYWVTLEELTEDEAKVEQDRQEEWLTPKKPRRWWNR